MYGIFSAVGLGITILFTIKTYNNTKNSDTTIIIQTLSIASIILFLTFIFVSAYYLNKINKNKEYKTEYILLDSKFKSQVLTNKYQSECFHNITHYYGNSIAKIDEGIENYENLIKEEKIEIVRRLDYFFVILTSSLQNYFSFVSEDNCSVTIKLINEDEKYFRTFFRDPINFNKRRKSYDEKNNYLISENTGLSIIVDSNYKNNSFYDDNLKQLYDSHQYKNSNDKWFELYNATIIVPISMVIKKDERNILGFLTVDNFKGNLSNKFNEEFLFAVSDLLYNLFKKYRQFIELNYEDIKENERVKIFRMGN